ncbi:hypothetical protein ACFCW7_01230 [Paenibacillus glucanolyticus]|uniref:hypothetical protein n=1 Tax=Paenibacillus glucanolyticus TaxID=59843 RepID=UPI0018D2A886|nr:hypothetical protein [Paenibacillus glucanolyticus]
MMALKQQDTAMESSSRLAHSQASSNCNAQLMYPDKEMNNDDQGYDRSVEQGFRSRRQSGQ